MIKTQIKKGWKKTFQIKFSCFYLETTTKKIPLATINWQIRNGPCGSAAGIFRWRLLLCHYCGWSTSERVSEQLGAGWACVAEAAAQDAPSELATPLRWRLFPGTGNPRWPLESTSKKWESKPSSLVPGPGEFLALVFWYASLKSLIPKGGQKRRGLHGVPTTDFRWGARTTVQRYSEPSPHHM